MDMRREFKVVPAPSVFSSTLLTYKGIDKRVKSAMGSETMLFIGAHYEVKTPVVDRKSPNTTPQEPVALPCAKWINTSSRYATILYDQS